MSAQGSRIDRVRVLAPPGTDLAGLAPRMRQALSQWLDEASAHGLPADAIVLLQRMRLPWRAVRHADAQPLADSLREARHGLQLQGPTLGPTCSAVWFNDEAEVLASLAHDALSGTLGQRWWWRQLLGTSPHDENAQQRWVRSPWHVPHALGLLQAAHHDEAWLRHMAPSARGALLQALATAFPVSAQVLAWVRSGQAPLADMACSPDEATRLARLCHTLARRPQDAAHAGTWWGGPTVPASATTGHARQTGADAAMPDASAALSTGTDLGAPHDLRKPSAPARLAHRERTAHQQACGNPALGGVPDEGVARSTRLAPTDAGSGVASDALPSAPLAAMPSRVAASTLPPTAQPDAAADTPDRHRPGQVRARPTSPSDGVPPSHAGLPPIGTAPAPAAAPMDLGPHHRHPRVPSVGPSAPASPAAPVDTHAALPPAAALTRIDTRHAGLFFMLNIALSLGLYGDFTQPQAPGLPLSPWQFLRAAGQALGGPAVRADPLFNWLIAMDPSPPPRTPLPAGWRPPPGCPVALAQPLAAPASLRVLWPLVRARLALALGLPPTQAVAATLRLPAQVRARAGRVDVCASLAHLPLSVRLAGLDRDPGWLPAAGCDIRFHFEGCTP